MSSLFTDNDGNTNWGNIWYHARSAFAVLLSIGVLIGGSWFVYDKASTAYQQYKLADDYQTEGIKDVQVVIEPDSTGGDIANTLLDADVIKSRKAFTKVYNGMPEAQNIQAGTYRLKTQISSERAINMLLDKKNIVRNLLTVPEGLRLSTQFQVMSAKTKIPVEEFEKAAKSAKALGLPGSLDTVEGYLYPDTYEIGQKPTARSIVLQMAKQWNAVATRNKLNEGAKKLDLTPVEIMTVASILEAEAKPKDMPIVAGIIYNRLEKGMKLELDSTSYYATNTKPGDLLPKDFRTRWSEFNTYARAGLPPHPIGAPGEAAIKAALNPTKSEYLYWVTVNFETGETKFAKTGEEHEKNVAEWLAWCKTAKDKRGCPVG